MKAHGFTLLDLRTAHDERIIDQADRVGLSPATISNIERGRLQPPEDFVERVTRSYALESPEARNSVRVKLAALEEARAIKVHHVEDLKNGMWEVRGPGVAERLYRLSPTSAAMTAKALDRPFIALAQNPETLQEWAGQVEALAGDLLEHARRLKAEAAPKRRLSALAQAHEALQALTLRRISEHD